MKKLFFTSIFIAAGVASAFSQNINYIDRGAENKIYGKVKKITFVNFDSDSLGNIIGEMPKYKSVEEYDKLGNLKKTYSINDKGKASVGILFFYDKLGRLVERRQDDSSILFEYTTKKHIKQYFGNKVLDTEYFLNDSNKVIKKQSYYYIHNQRIKKRNSDHKYDNKNRLIECIEYSSNGKIFGRLNREYDENCYYETYEKEGHFTKMYICLDEYGKIIQQKLIEKNYNEIYESNKNYEIKYLYDENKNWTKRIYFDETENSYRTRIRTIEYYK